MFPAPPDQACPVPQAGRRQPVAHHNCEPAVAITCGQLTIFDIYLPGMGEELQFDFGWRDRAQQCGVGLDVVDQGFRRAVVQQPGQDG